MQEVGGAHSITKAGVHDHNSTSRRLVGQPEVPTGVCTRIIAVPDRYPACKTGYNASQKR